MILTFLSFHYLSKKEKKKNDFTQPTFTWVLLLILGAKIQFSEPLLSNLQAQQQSLLKSILKFCFYNVIKTKTQNKVFHGRAN